MEAQLPSQGETALPPEHREDESNAAAALQPAHDEGKGKKATAGVSTRPRSIKTPLQREALEAAYLINQFPAEEVRRALGDRIQLTENQVQVWFSHKRRKDKKTQAAGAQPASTQATPPAAAIPSPLPPAAPAPPSTNGIAPAVPASTAAPLTAPTLSQPHSLASSVAALHALAAAPSSTSQTSQPAAASTSAPQARHQQAAVTAAPPSASVMSVSAQLDRVRPQPQSAQLPYNFTQASALPGSLPTTHQPGSSALQAPTSVGPHSHIPSVYQSQLNPHLHAALLNSMPHRPTATGHAFTEYPYSHAATHNHLAPHLQVASATLQPPRQPAGDQPPAQPSYPGVLPASSAALHRIASIGNPSPEASPASHRLTLPLTAGTFTVGASPAWLHQQQRQGLQLHQSAVSSPAQQSTPAARGQSDAMHDDYATDDNEMVYERLRPDLRQLIELAKRCLPVPYRPDGPPLAVDFDDLPLGDNQQADPDGPAKRKRVLVDGYEMEEDGEDGMNFKKARINPGQRAPSANRGREDAERKVHKEFARADLLAKRVEQTMQKDKERMEREKKRVQEKMDREKKKDEVAQQKAADKLRQFHEREAKKAAERAEKEKKAEERKRLQDEKRRERDMLRALAAQERQATRQRQRTTEGPKDDEDIEWEQLMEAHHQAGYGSGTEDHPDQDNGALPVRPEFPSPGLQLIPAFAMSLDPRLGADMLQAWTFLHSFGDLLGLPAATLDDLLAAVMNGEQSRLLGEIHIALLKLLVADMEEAYATGVIQGGGATNFMDRAIVNCAHYLEEALAWGFDVNVWRAHLNAQTWPEVMRQYGIAAGLGQKRPKPKKDASSKAKLGTEGEDIITDEAGRVTLVAPSRFGLGTVKGAAYKVLQEVGPDGLTITEIAKRIQDSGLRDLRTSKTPEASVAGALSRDVIFTRIAPATYALKAKLTQQRPAGAIDPAVKIEVKTEDVKAEDVEAEVKQESADVKQEADHDEELLDSDLSDEEEELEEKTESGEAWLQLLKTHEYNHLTFEQRVAALKTLVHMAIDGPAVRATLEARTEESQRIRKQMFEEAKADKRRRQQEAADKAKRSAEEAQRALEAYNANPDAMNVDSATPADSNRQDATPTAQTTEDEAAAAAAAKARQQQRADLLRRAEESHAVRGEPLGLDRRHNRYWHLAADPTIPGDSSTGRILVESHVDGTWRLMYRADQMQQLMDSLERKGAREGPLYNALVRHQPTIAGSMPSQAIQMPLALHQQPPQQQTQLGMEHHAWLWSVAIQATAQLHGRDPVSSLSMHKGETTSLTKLKADMLRVEGAMPNEALRDSMWDRATWQSTVRKASNVAQLQHALAELEMAIHPSSMWNNPSPRPFTAIKQDWLPLGQDIYGRLPTPALQLPAGQQQAAGPAPAPIAEHMGCLPTSAAVSLRLHAIDAAIVYQPGGLPARETLLTYKYIQRPVPLSNPSTTALLNLQPMHGGAVSHKGKRSLFPPFPQALLQGPRQTFKLPVADFKQAVRDAENGVNYPGKSSKGLKVRLPIGKLGLAGQAAKKSKPSAPRNRSASATRTAPHSSKPASRKELLQRQLSEGDMDTDDIVPGRSTTATPGPSDDEMLSPSRSGFDEEPDISSDDNQGNDVSDVELSD